MGLPSLSYFKGVDPGDGEGDGVGVAFVVMLFFPCCLLRQLVYSSLESLLVDGILGSTAPLDGPFGRPMLFLSIISVGNSVA